MIAALLLAQAAVAAPQTSALPPVTAAPALPSTPPPTAAPMGSPADMGFFSAGALADRCIGSAASDISYCFAYITAVHDTMKAYEVWLETKEFCVPRLMAQADLRRAFLTYISAYPANRGGQAASVIVVALKQTYPCLAPDPAPLPLTAPPKPKAPARP